MELDRQLDYRLKRLIKRMIEGTALERPARWIHDISLGQSRASPCVIANTLYDRQTIDVMERVLKESSNCVDVGCHVGSILGEMLRLAPKGTHFAFEPIPELYQGLVTALKPYANVKVYQLALSDSAGQTSFQHVVSNPGYSGLKTRKYDRPNEAVETITVRTDLLDNVVPEHVSIDLIKIDVEGAEFQVLKGAVKTIQRTHPVIVFEHGLGAADYYGTKPEDLYDLLTSRCDLKISLMERWLGGLSSLSKKEFSTQFYKAINFYFIAYPEAI